MMISWYINVKQVRVGIVGSKWDEVAVYLGRGGFLGGLILAFDLIGLPGFGKFASKPQTLLNGALDLSFGLRITPSRVPLRLPLIKIP